MTTQDLRIGNYLEFQRKIVQVDWIDKYDEIGHNDKSYLLKMYTPIPLTKKWLVKFGFDHQYKLIKSQDFFVIEINSDTKLFINLNKMEYSIYKSYIGIVYSSKIQYLHTLQNLYHSLTGEELTIKN
jgi:hypothetical protein